MSMQLLIYAYENIQLYKIIQYAYFCITYAIKHLYIK